METKKKAVYSVVYSTAHVFLHSRSQKQSPEVFCKKSVLNVLSNILLKCSFKGKQLCRGLFLMKCHKKETATQMFFSEYCEIFKNTYFQEHL